MTDKWTYCYWMRPYFRNVGLSVTLFAGGMTIVSAIAWWTQPPNAPDKMPFVNTIFSVFMLLGVYLLSLHGRYRLLVGESVIRQTGVFRDDEVSLNSVDELKWRYFSPPIDSPLHHHLLHPSRLGKIILGHQQVALLRDLR